MRVLAVVVTMLLTGCSSHLPTNTQILSVDWLKDIVQPCSRQGPGLVTNGWKVTPQIAMQIEQALPDIADRMRGEDPRSYFRQYIGIVRGNKQLVYINAFPPEDIQYAKRGSFLSSGPVVVCDGGRRYWGAIYDPTTHQLSELRFNGNI